jgi:hypothetical protein
MRDVLQEERMEALLHVRIAPLFDFMGRSAFCHGLILSWARTQAQQASF